LNRCTPGSLLPRGSRAFSRRDLLALAARGAGAALAAPSLLDLLFRQAFAQAAPGGARRRKLILLWLDGGPSQIDTFDPKPGTPSQGPFQVIPTAVDGWTMGEHLPQLARCADRLALVRSMTSQESTHARARELLHAGYVPNASVNFPSLGSIVAHQIGDLDHDLPAFVQVSGAPVSSGYLGIECEPFHVEDPSRRIENLQDPLGGEPGPARARDEMLALLDGGFAARGGARAAAMVDTQRRRARRLMQTRLLSAFELDREPDALRAAYGGGAFGQGVLLARRLVEHGVAAVEVILDGWDTHADNFNRTRDLCRQLDPAFATLVADLAGRGLLEETLVVCMGEFGRTPAITPSLGRNHWPNNYCVVLAGCGVRPGTVVGETDETGVKIVKRPVQVADLFATFARLLGIDRDREFPTASGRTIRLIDPEGNVVSELLG